MNAVNAEKFLNDNKDAIKLLGKKIREIDTVRDNRYSQYPEESRKMAIEIVEGWLTEIFSIKQGDLPSAWEEEDDIYRRLDS